MNLKMDFGVIFVLTVLLAVVLKFASIVCLRLALEEYQNLSANGIYFFYAIVASVAPSALLAPIYTYDHDNCIPTNFVLTQKLSGLISAIAFLILFFCAIILIVSPTTCMRWSCCRSDLKTGQVNPQHEPLADEDDQLIVPGGAEGG